MWQAWFEQVKDQGVVLVTVGMDALGMAGCGQYIQNANPTHPSLIDEHHTLANLYGVVNIPQAIWIDENFQIVRPLDSAPPPPAADQPATAPPDMSEMPQRMLDIMKEAAQIQSDAVNYHAALSDWVANGAASQFALPAEEVIERSTPRDFAKSQGHAHFELATELEKQGRHELAVKHFREAHRLVPDSWTFRRQAWSLETVGDGPFARFWQGPAPDDSVSWPYEGDWLTDIRSEGPANYYSSWKP